MIDLSVLTDNMFLINLIVIISTALYGVAKIAQSYTHIEMKVFKPGNTDNLLIGITNVLVSLMCLALII